MFCDIRYDKTIIVEKEQQQNYRTIFIELANPMVNSNWIQMDAMFVVCWIKGSNYNWKHARLTWEFPWDFLASGGPYYETLRLVVDQRMDKYHVTVFYQIRFKIFIWGYNINF